MELIGLIFGSLAIFYSLLTSKCIKNLFDHPENFNNLNEEINLCEIAKNSTNFPQELRDEILKGDNECTLNLTAAMCNEIFMEAKINFAELVNRTIKSFYQNEIEMTLPHEKCIYDTFDEYKLVNAYLKLFLEPDVIFNNVTGNEIEMLSTPVRIVRSYCNGDELYAEKFDSHRHDVRNSSDLEPCYVQYLIDRGFVMGKLSERPTHCENKDVEFERLINSDFLLRDFRIGNFFASKKIEIQECFLKKTLEFKVPQKSVGIEYSYVIHAPDVYNMEDERKKFVQLMKLKDEIFIKCLVI